LKHGTGGVGDIIPAGLDRWASGVGKTLQMNEAKARPEEELEMQDQDVGPAGLASAIKLESSALL